MAIELTPDRIEAFRQRVEPELSPIQRLAAEHIWLAAEHIWEWLDELWRDEAVASEKLSALSDELLPRLEEIAGARGQERDQAIVSTVDFLRSIEIAHLSRG